METLKNKRVIRMIIIFMLLVLFSKIPIIDKINLIGKFVGHSQINYSNVITVTSRDGYLSIILLDVSALFIVTTLMALLGEKKCIIYHKDIMYEKLIRPMWTNFLDVTIYSFFSMILCILGFVFKSASMVVMMSCAVFTFICLLSLKMIMIFFNHNGWKKKIQGEIFNAMERNSDLYKKHIIELKNLLEKQIVEGDNSEIVSNLELLALCAFEENRMNKYSFAGYWFSVSCRMLKRYHPTELVRFYMTMYKRAYQKDKYIKKICECAEDNQREFGNAFNKCLNRNVLHNSSSGVPGKTAYYEDVLGKTETALEKYYNKVGDDNLGFDSSFEYEEVIFDELPYKDLMHYSFMCVDVLARTLKMAIKVEKRYIKRRSLPVNLTSQYINTFFVIPKYIYNWDKNYFIYLARRVEEIAFDELFTNYDNGGTLNYLMGSYIAGYYHYLIFDQSLLEKQKSEKENIVRNHFFKLLQRYYHLFGKDFLLVDFCDMIKFFPSNDIVTYLDSWYDIIECDLLNSCLSNLSLSVLCDEVESTIPCESYIEDDRMQEWEQVKNKSDLLPVCEKSDDYDEKSSINTMELAKQRNEIKEYFFEIYELHKDNEAVVKAINRYITVFL